MAKIKWKEGYAKKNDPIYRGGFVISTPIRRTNITNSKTKKGYKNGEDIKKHTINKRKYTFIS